MEIAAGYGSRVEFASDSSISSTFIREFTHFAYTAVDRAKLQLSHHGVPYPESIDVGGGHADGVESLTDVDLSSYDQQYFRDVSYCRAPVLVSQRTPVLFGYTVFLEDANVFRLVWRYHFRYGVVELSCTGHNLGGD